MNKRAAGDIARETDGLKGEKPVLHAGKQKEGKLSLSYMARRTFSSKSHR